MTSAINCNAWMCCLEEVYICAIVYLVHLKVCVEGMPVVVNIMLSLMSVMSSPPTLYNLSVRRG